jgi:hypothetical protein
VVDNADMQRVARMVTETQRVRVRLLWDDQRMRQTTAAYGLDRLGKAMAAAYGLDRLGKTMAAAHRKRMRPLFNTPKFVGPMFGGELQRAAQTMAEAHRASMRPALDASKVIRFGVGGEQMRQMMAAAAGLDRVADAHRGGMRPLFDTRKLVGPMFGGQSQRMAQAITGAYRMPVRPLWGGEQMQHAMAAAAGLDKVTKVVADTQRMRMRPLFEASKLIKVGLGGEFQRMAQAMAGAYRVRMPPLFDTQKLVGSMFGGEFERIGQAMADAYRAPVRPRFNVQGVVEVAQDLADATIAVPSTATTRSLAVVDGSVPARAPLLPGLMDPWEQVRFWDLQAWITFLAFLVAVAGLLVAIGQSRPQVGLSPEELEKVIRIIQEHQEPKTSTPAPNSTTASTRSKPTRPLDGEKDHVPAARPSPTSG